jgi:hypothetical protein
VRPKDFDTPGDGQITIPNDGVFRSLLLRFVLRLRKKLHDPVRT